MARPATGQVVERRGPRGTVYGLRFRAYGKRRYVTTNATSYAEAETELANVLADVRRGIWRPPNAAPIIQELPEEPTFHRLSSDWVAARTHEVDPRTVEHWRWALSCHLLPHFKDYRPSQITVAHIEAYKAAQLTEDEPLSNNSINKTLKVLAQVLDYAQDLVTSGARIRRGGGSAGSRRRSPLGHGWKRTRYATYSTQQENTARYSQPSRLRACA